MLVKTNEMARNELSPAFKISYTTRGFPSMPTIKPFDSSSYTAASNNRNLAYIAVLIPIVLMLTVARVLQRRRQRKRVVRKLVETVLRSRPNVYIIEGPPTGSETNIRGATSSNNGRRPNQRTQQNLNVNSARSQTSYNPSNVNQPTAPVLPPPVYRNNTRFVPFTHLPPNFDFSSPQVEVRSDFVIIKDVPNHSRRKPEEVEKPPPYNEAMTSFFRT